MSETLTTQVPKQVAPLDQIKTTLESMSDRLQAVLPSHVKPDKFIRVALVAIQNNDYLLQCDRTSLYSACMKAATDGLIPDGREAAFVPYKGKIQYQPMILGMCKKARNSGDIKALDALEVHEKDDYQSWTDENGPHFKHTKARGDRGKLLCVFAYAITNTSGTYFEEISAEEIEAIKKAALASKKDASFSPWTGPFEGEMRRKTALRRLLKYRVPSSSDIMDFEQEAEEMVAQAVEPEAKPEAQPEPSQPAPQTSSRLASVVAAQTPAPAPVAITQQPTEELPL